MPTPDGGNASPLIRKGLSRFVVAERDSILEAMRVIEEGSERLAIVVDVEKRVTGVVSDGDIRRAILHGSPLTVEVGKIANTNPVTVNEGCGQSEIDKLLNDRVRVLPVLDPHRILTGVYCLRDRETFIEIRNLTVCVVGMGYVGLTLGLSLADNGFRVYGYDKNPQVAAMVRGKEAPFHEKGIRGYLDLHVGRNFSVIDKPSDPSANIYVVSVGTPIDKETGQAQTEHLREAVRDIGGALKGGELIVVRSTVPVGCTRSVVIPILEESSGLEAGRDFYVAMCPERTAEGRAMQELRAIPQIVGGLDAKSVELVSRLFNEQTQTIIDVGGLEAAEMCKLLDNTYRDVIFSYSNHMAELCEKLGLDLCRLIEAVNNGYARNRIPRPSPGVGGACLSKDPYILMDVFSENNLDPILLRAARTINEAGPSNLVNRIEQALASAGKSLENAKVFMVGFAFKGEPETSDLRESTSLWFLNAIKETGARLFGYDPVVPADQIENLGVMAVSLDAGFAEADVAVLLNNHRSYADMDIHGLIRTMRRPAVFMDCWHVFEPERMKQIPGILYATVGS